MKLRRWPRVNLSIPHISTSCGIVINRATRNTSASGTVGGGTTFPSGLPPGTEVAFQFLCQDLTTFYGMTLSNGLKGTTP